MIFKNIIMFKETYRYFKRFSPSNFMYNFPHLLPSLATCVKNSVAAVCTLHYCILHYCIHFLSFYQMDHNQTRKEILLETNRFWCYHFFHHLQTTKIFRHLVICVRTAYQLMLVNQKRKFSYSWRLCFTLFLFWLLIIVWNSKIHSCISTPCVDQQLFPNKTFTPIHFMLFSVWVFRFNFPRLLTDGDPSINLYGGTCSVPFSFTKVRVLPFLHITIKFTRTSYSSRSWSLLNPAESLEVFTSSRSSTSFRWLSFRSPIPGRCLVFRNYLLEWQTNLAIMGHLMSL